MPPHPPRLYSLLGTGCPSYPPRCTSLQCWAMNPGLLDPDEFGFPLQCLFQPRTPGSPSSLLGSERWGACGQGCPWPSSLLLHHMGATPWRWIPIHEYPGGIPKRLPISPMYPPSSSQSWESEANWGSASMALGQGCFHRMGWFPGWWDGTGWAGCPPAAERWRCKAGCSGGRPPAWGGCWQ